MKRASLFALILSLVASPTPAATPGWTTPESGPLARSIATEAARLAASQKKPDADDLAWASVQETGRDTEVDVLDRSGTVTRGRLAEVNDAAVRVRNGVLSTWIARGDVVEIATQKGGGSPAGVAGGVALGILAALVIAPAIGFSPCHGSCTDGKFLIGATVIGLPVGLGIAGYHAVPRMKSRVIYRASQSSADVAP
jgi:hypothetical protein